MGACTPALRAGEVAAREPGARRNRPSIARLMSGAHDAGDLGGRLAAAAALADDGQVAAAIASYAALLHERPHELEAMLRLAGLFVTQGNLAYARAVLLEAATSHPERPEPAGLLGNVLVDL